KTMVVVTFIAGLLPVIGNLISNTVIVVVSLSVSPLLAVGSLAFLVVIHKLEYFVNARGMGGQIRARAWELLKFTWSSQHLERGGCDGHSEAAFGSVRARCLALARSALGGAA